jgi:dipeptidyl aminopeptidase/acylaminoacyl peptidase
VSEANHISQKGSDPYSIRSPLASRRVLLNCLLMMSGACVTLCHNRAFCCDQSVGTGNTLTAHSATVRPEKRPVTVADSIQMTRLGDPGYTEGALSNGIAAKFSPDGKHFVVILKKGNLDANTNEYSLVLFQTAEVFRSPEPQVLVSMASSSNRPAINNVLWLDDNDTILFLGERLGEQTQLYSLKVGSKQLKRLTNHATNLTSFVTTVAGNVIAYTTQNPASTFLTEGVARKGLVVTDQVVTDLIRGSYGGGENDNHSLFVERLGTDSQTRVSIQGQIEDYPPMSLSPDGKYLLVQTEAPHVSKTWSAYEDQYLKVFTRHPAPDGGHTSILQYQLVDTITGKSQVLLDAPIGSFGSEMAWSPDSKSVVVSDIYLPLDGADPAERALRKAHTYLVEFKIPSGAFVKMSDGDLRLLGWDPKTGYVACDVGRIDSLNGKVTPKAYFQKGSEAWSQSSSAGKIAVSSLPDIILEEGINTPPRLFAVDPPTARKSLLMDLNPQLQNLAVARVEEIKWKASHGIEARAGLYWPQDYVAGRKYPLVIQTHAWSPAKFWMDGPWPTAFAAQALAGKGFFVLQQDDPDWHVWVTSKEAPTAMAAYESAIQYLDQRGLIDKRRVGIIGFSRTFWYVTYTLTHSKYHFSAAAVADGVDGSYFQYMTFPWSDPDSEQVFGGPPFGKRLPVWLKESPAFRMDKIETPLRIQTLGPMSLLLDWHWYSGLSRLGRPVEMIYIPGGTHILEKPWERMTSQQGDVDWFCFWMKGEEDPDPAKAEQYQRWRELRRRQGLADLHP